MIIRFIFLSPYPFLNYIIYLCTYNYSKRHNKFLFPSLAGAIYGNEIYSIVNYKIYPKPFYNRYGQSYSNKSDK